jgi:hypothetical protein
LLKKPALEKALKCQLGSEKKIEGTIAFTAHTTLKVVVDYKSESRSFVLDTAETVLWNEKNATAVKAWVELAASML